MTHLMIYMKQHEHELREGYLTHYKPRTSSISPHPEESIFTVPMRKLISFLNIKPQELD